MIKLSYACLILPILSAIVWNVLTWCSLGMILRAYSRSLGSPACSRICRGADRYQTRMLLRRRAEQLREGNCQSSAFLDDQSVCNLQSDPVQAQESKCESSKQSCKNHSHSMQCPNNVDQIQRAHFHKPNISISQWVPKHATWFAYASQHPHNVHNTHKAHEMVIMGSAQISSHWQKSGAVASRRYSERSPDLTITMKNCR